LEDGPADPQFAVRQVDVSPPDAAGLTAPQAAYQQEPVQHADAVVGGMAQERGHLVRGPDLGRVAGLGGQFDAGARVVGDPALADRRRQGVAQRGEDPVLGGDTGDLFRTLQTTRPALTRQNLSADRLLKMAAWPGRTGNDGFTGEQAALRRVATLVARGAPPEEVFAAVTEEAGRLLHADHASMARYGPDDTVSVVATWGSGTAAFPVGSQWSLGGQNLQTMTFETGRPARIDDNAAVSGGLAGEAASKFGLRAAVGVPVSVEGRLWGLMAVASRAGPLPAGTESRLAGFTELAATAIANVQARTELREFAKG
jgi:hypothetical protein